MMTLRITTVVPTDRRVTLHLPSDVPAGPAELVVTVDPVTTDRERTRADALAQFLTLARSSSFRSAGPYPSRTELHERD